MNVLLTGGGTAGHINPALAIAHTIRQNIPNANIAFVGIKSGKETELIPREGYPLYYVESMGFVRPLWSPMNAKAAWLAFYSPRSRKTKKILEEFRPDIVIGTGGYACYPLMMAAIRKKIPCALHESNALPGLVVRQLHKKVDRVWLNFDHTAAVLNNHKNTLTVGNPLRAGFGGLSKAAARERLGISGDRFVVLAFGGSLGAQKVNDAVLDAMQTLSSSHPSLLCLHATGSKEHQRVCGEVKSRGLEGASNYVVMDYIHDMPLRMAAADLVVCRAGAMTLSEIANMKKASVLIPSPNVVDDHQLINAKVFSDAGAAVLLEEANMKANSLSNVILSLMNDREALRDMETNVASFAREDANRMIWKDILRLTKKK